MKTRSRRAALAALSGAAAALAASCSPRLELPKPPAPELGPSGEPTPAPPLAPAPEAAVAPPVGTPAALQPTKLTRLAPQQVERVVQPFWSADGKQILYYDQPRAGQGGTWAIDAAAGTVSHVRPEWGLYTARGALLAVPEPAKRQSWIKHTGSGAEWTLPSAGPVFSADATVVAYARDGGLTVAGADDQGARRVSLPIGGATVLAWLPGTDGTANARLLLYGRSADGVGLFAYDLGTRRAQQLSRSKRMPGYSLSPDGTWLAHVQMWNANPAENGLWVTRTDGGVRRRMPVVGSTRWTADNRLLLMPHRASAADSHEVWEVNPASGALRRLVGPEQARFRVANCDWDCTPDGSQIAFVSAEDKGVWRLDVPRLPAGAGSPEGASLPEVGDPQPAIARSKPYRLPFQTAPSPGGWYVSQWYGVTTAGYRWRVSSYGQGQGIHFGIDFATPMRTPVVAIAGGRIIAVDGDYGSAPHNVVIELFDGNQAVYGHLAERSRHVEVGQEVQQGDVVGLSGDSGYPYDGSRNPHLHLEIRKQGRMVATNPVPYFDANWDDMSLGVWNGALFERDLDNPRRYQFLDEQPDIRFGGPIISNFARPWPPA